MAGELSNPGAIRSQYFNTDQNNEFEESSIVNSTHINGSPQHEFGHENHNRNPFNPHYNVHDPLNHQMMRPAGGFNQVGMSPLQMHGNYNMYDAQVMQNTGQQQLQQQQFQQQQFQQQQFQQQQFQQQQFQQQQFQQPQQMNYKVGNTPVSNNNIVQPWSNDGSQKNQGTLGDEVTDDGTGVEPCAPPPPDIDTAVPGYEGTMSFDQVSSLPPPVYDDVVQEVKKIDAAKIKKLTVDESRSALLEYVANHSCYGKGAANEMFIKDIDATSACHYTLETFTESRNTKWHQVPYSGGIVDGPELGKAPGAWEINCPFTNLFQTETKLLDIPHTSMVKGCHICMGRGFCRCWRCHGHGRVRCSSCGGSGYRSVYRDGEHRRTSCSMCFGGRRNCTTCHSNGSVRCTQCCGYGKMRQFIQLIINFTNHTSDHIIERSDMPDHLIRDVTGDIVFEQSAFRVAPVQNFVDDEINTRSEQIVQQHASAWNSERVIQQRQILRCVPVYECQFKFKSKEGRFWVYGNQHSVFTEDYPQTCLCCSIA